jgi:hypothetical protein
MQRPVWTYNEYWTPDRVVRAAISAIAGFAGAMLTTWLGFWS